MLITWKHSLSQLWKLFANSTECWRIKRFRSWSTTDFPHRQINVSQKYADEYGLYITEMCILFDRNSFDIDILCHHHIKKWSQRILDIFWKQRLCELICDLSHQNEKEKTFTVEMSLTANDIWNQPTNPIFIFASSHFQIGFYHKNNIILSFRKCSILVRDIWNVIVVARFCFVTHFRLFKI